MNPKQMLSFYLLAITCIALVPACSYIASIEITTDPALSAVVEPAAITPRASGYNFRVTNETAHFFLKYDGSVTIKYWITFKNLYSLDVLDVVDISFPNSKYLFDTVKARITTGGGSVWHDLTNIVVSPYVQYGVAVDLGPYDIVYNGEETLYVECNNPLVLNTDSQDSSKASFAFTPTWFDSSSGGTTIDSMNVMIYFPPNELDGSSVGYHQKPSPWYPPATGIENFTSPLEQRLYYSWSFSSISQGPHEFGASFPKSWVDQSLFQPPFNYVWVWVILIAVSISAPVIIILTIKHLNNVRAQNKSR